MRKKNTVSSMTKEVWKAFNHNLLTHSAAHYLMSVHKIQNRKGYARLTDIANELNISAASASQSLKALLAKNFIKENEDKFFLLTDFGLEKIELVEKNKALTLKFFTEVLGVSEKQADTDSCKIEHLLSPETSDRLAEFLEIFSANKK